MLIDVKSISRSRGASLTIETETDPEEMSSTLKEYWLTRPLIFNGTLQNGGEGVMNLEGRIRTTYNGECARCLTQVEVAVDLPLSEIYRLSDLAGAEDDAESYRYNDTVIDLSQAIRDNLVLAMPIRLLCREDCRGLCPVCGVNLNDLDDGHSHGNPGVLPGYDDN